MSFLDAFILLLVIMDPIISLSALLSLSKEKSRKQLREIAVKSTLVAFFIFVIFAVGGEFVFQSLGVNINSFRVAGGIILIILGIEMVMGIALTKKREISEIAVVIGTPLISGPATIMTTIILVKSIGLTTTILAGLPALLIVFIVLLFALRIRKFLGLGGMQLLATMMGIVTMAWGVQFLVSGLAGFF